MSIINTPGKIDFAGRDGFVWWLGEIEKVDAANHRCKVRVLGWYTGNEAKKSPDAGAGEKGSKLQSRYLDEVKTDDLPWAYVMLPNDQEGISNVGTAVRLQVGAVVIGFFADGDEAQVPIIMGNIKGYKLKPNTTFADNTENISHDAATQAQSHSGTDTTKVVGNQQVIADVTPDAPGAAAKVQSARGTPSPMTAALAGTGAGSISNPAALPSEPQTTADGIMGPAGKSLEQDLRRMLNEIGQNFSSVMKNEKGEFVSIITGKMVKLNHLIDNVKGFISRAITGIMSWLKEILARVIQKIIDTIVGIISNFIPLGVTVAILGLIQFILELFCNFEAAYILGYIDSALSNVTGFVNSITSQIVDKFLSPAFAFAAKVEDTINKVLGNIQQGLNKAIQIGNTLVNVISTVKGVAKVAGGFKEIFQVDFTKLDWKSIISIIKLLLGLFIKKDCGRTTKQRTPKMWLPLLGTSECDNINDALKADYNIPLVKTAGKIDSAATLKNFAANLWSNMDPNLVKVTSFLNGAWELHDSTKGKVKKVVSGPGAVTTIEDDKGNKHTNVPVNETKIIGKDSCETTKGHKVLTIEGDLTLKVMGNFNLEVGGTVNKHVSAGIDRQKGENKQPKLATTEASDKNINQQGDITLQAPNIKLTAISNINLKASSIKNECVSMTNSVDGECFDEFGMHTEMINSMKTTIIALFNPLAPVTGRLTYMQGADMCIVQEKLIGIPGVPPVKMDVTLGVKQPTGFIRLATGATNATSIDLMQGATAAAGRFVQGGSGLIVDANNSGGGASIYHNAVGIFAAGCLAGPAQFYGLPIFLN
jgi:hypothetical protein